MGKNAGLILIAIAVAILSAIGTGYFILNSSYFKSSLTVEAMPPVFIQFDRLITNLAEDSTDDTLRYASIELGLKVDNQEAKDAITPYIPVLRNEALLIFSSKTYTELIFKY